MRGLPTSPRELNKVNPLQSIDTYQPLPQYESLERAIAWLENHENDPDIDDPIEESGGNVLGSSSDPGQTQR